MRFRPLRSLLALGLVGMCPSLMGGCAVAAPDGVPETFVMERGDASRGRLLAMQVFAQEADYATQEFFEARLRALFEDASHAGLLDERTVVVLPEYVGSWLVVAEEGAAIYDKDTLGDALTELALGHLPAFVWAQMTAPEGTKDGAAHAAFSIKSERMAAIYVDTMRALARDFEVTLVAGSILLPAPHMKDGALVVTPGAPLENVSAVFDASGALLALSKKVHPTADELPFVRGAEVSDIAVVDTPVGRLGVLVCADAWFPDAYAQLAREGAELLAVPTFHSGKWDADWKGYSGANEPDDVDPDDIGVLTEAQAWDRYALAARAKEAGVVAAVSAPLRGSLWDLHDDGQAFLVDERGFERAPREDAPGLMALGLSEDGAE
jgi:predicted amidohydrolase